MRILLRASELGKFLGPRGMWVRRSDAALDFETVDEATDYAFSNELCAMEVVLRYEQPQCELTLPIESACFGELERVRA